MYELCSDLVDVIIDVSYIYGTTAPDSANAENGQGTTDSPYDSSSASVIRLNTGRVLYLRAVSNYLALVCVIPSEVFVKRALVDYNIDCFRSSLSKVFNEVIQTNSMK